MQVPELAKDVFSNDCKDGGGIEFAILYPKLYADLAVTGWLILLIQLNEVKSFIQPRGQVKLWKYIEKRPTH